MANKTFPQGLAPVSSNGDTIATGRFPKSTSSVLDLFLHSPVAVKSGQVLSAVASQTAPSGATVNGGITGSVVALMNSDFSPTQNLAAAAAGYCVVTLDRNQRFIMRITATTYADADAGKTYRLTTETATLASATSYGDNFSKRTLDNEGVEGLEQITVGSRVLPPAANINDAAVAGTLVYCQITPTFHFSAA